MKMKNVLTIVLVSLISAVAAVGLFKLLGGEKVVYQLAPSDAGFETVSYKDNKPAGTPFDFTLAAEKGLPSVVHIRSTVERSQSSNQSQQRQPQSMDDFFDQFFGQRGGPQRELPPATGFGSGVVISPDGYIVTNNHVIDNASEVKVTFYDNKILTAELVGTDPTTDIALLKVKQTGLPYLKFADSDDIKIGQWVAAIGNPAVGGDAYTLKSTVTAGIVSAIGRNINIIQENLKIESFIQTDAVINRGNSGGALVDSNGDLVGINSAISTPTGVYAGYGFAVPSDLVKKVVTDLKEYGEVQRALLGVRYSDIEMVATQGDVSVLDTKEKEGLYIADVSPGSAAEKAGVKVGDVFIEVDGNDVTKGQQNKLQEIIGRKRPGDVVNVKYIRDGKKMSTTITLLSAEKTDENYRTVKNVTKFDELGLSLEELTDSQKEDLEISTGVRVSEINRDGMMYRGSYGDITVGFIITSINGKEVSTIMAAQNALKAGNGKTVQIRGFNENDPSSLYTYTFPLTGN